MGENSFDWRRRSNDPGNSQAPEPRDPGSPGTIWREASDSKVAGARRRR